MALTLLALLLSVGARAVELPESWRCPAGEEARYWAGVKQIAPKLGPAWGEALGESAPTPFVWLAIYQARDRDVAERRAPITSRWAEFDAGEKCAYLGHFVEEARRRKREFDALLHVRDDGGVRKRISRLVPAELIAAQGQEPLKGWRERFDAMASWLAEQGLREGEGGAERALGVLVKIGQLETARSEFLIASGHFSASVRGRFALASSTSAGGFLPEDPALREHVIADLAEQLSKDWRNETILGSDFERRVRESLDGYRRRGEQAAASARLGALARTAEEHRAVRKRSEAAVDRLERQLKDEKLLFPAGADPALLTSLEEYRQGKRRLYELLESASPPSSDGLVSAYLELLAEVCLTHYTSIRYKGEVIKILCGK